MRNRSLLGVVVSVLCALILTGGLQACSDAGGGVPELPVAPPQATVDLLVEASDGVEVAHVWWVAGEGNDPEPLEFDGWPALPYREQITIDPTRDPVHLQAELVDQTPHDWIRCELRSGDATDQDTQFGNANPVWCVLDKVSLPATYAGATQCEVVDEASLIERDRDGDGCPFWYAAM